MINEKQIDNIVRNKNYNTQMNYRKSEKELSDIKREIIDAYKNWTFDFKKFVIYNIMKNSKKRKVAQYKKFSIEEILCIYIQKMLMSKFHIRFNNRNTEIKILMNVLESVKHMSNFTIFKFDFKDFFNSNSAIYIYNKFIINKGLSREGECLINNFVEKTKYTYMGLNTSNVLCEIISREFDRKLRNKFNNDGLIFYSRYVDDGIVIFNKYISINDCESKIEEVIREVFYDPNIKGHCNIKLNNNKLKYIAIRDMIVMYQSTNLEQIQEIDFLGYKLTFIYNNRLRLLYGITADKIDKYKKHIKSIVNEYTKTHNINLLRHMLYTFTRRIVYRNKKYKELVWVEKGFISNYGELRNKQLDDITKDFLMCSVRNAFKHIGIPYFLKNNGENNSYNLYNNLETNRSLILVPEIGVSLNKLKKMCGQIGIVTTGKTNYSQLVREYLIKTKVGF